MDQLIALRSLIKLSDSTPQRGDEVATPSTDQDDGQDADGV